MTKRGRPRRGRKPILCAAALIVLAGVVGALLAGSPGIAAGAATVALCGLTVFFVELTGEQGFRLRMARSPFGSGWRSPHR